MAARFISTANSLGAVAFSFPFAKDAVAGITPITQMVDAFAEQAESGPIGGKIILKKSMLWDYQLQLPEAGYKNQSILVNPLEARLSRRWRLSRGIP